MSYYQFDYDENGCLFELKDINKSIPLCEQIKVWTLWQIFQYQCKINKAGYFFEIIFKHI